MDSSIKKLRKYSDLSQIANPEVSSSSVGWHLAHSLLVIIKVSQSFVLSNEEHFSASFTWRKFIVFLVGKFPRGKAKAPEAVQPMQYHEEDLDQLFAEAEKALEGLKLGNKNQFFKHPIFGNLNKKETLRFLQIHTNHHLKIIKDIVRKNLIP